MNKPSVDEALSAMLDDALSRHEVEQLLERLRDDPQRGECMGRYSLIGMAMRGELARAPSHDMTARIMARIRAEQRWPARRLRSFDTLREGLERWRIPALGLALAATVAGVAVFLVQPMSHDPAGAFVARAPQHAPHSGVQVAAHGPQEMHDAEVVPDPYLLQHLTHAEDGPVTSMAANVRLVAYERP